MSVSYGGDSITFADGSVNSSGFIGHRNRIINGAMVIDQRNAGASVTVNSTTQTFSVDRWWASGQSTDGVFTMQQSSTAPSGFSNSTAITVTTADASIGTTQRYYFAQRIEGFNTADLGWGTAGASTVTLSFWVRSSITGTFGGFVYNSDADYSYPFSYTISSANTWEQKSVTIAGPTAGTWVGATNGFGMQIGWSLGTGTDRLGTSGAWTASQKFGATGQTNLIATNGATFYITGVQLERGSTASSFEYRSYGTELALCQRYFEKSNYVNGDYVGSSGFALTAGTSYFSYACVVEKRTTPTWTSSGTFRGQGLADTGTSTGVSLINPGNRSVLLLVSATYSGTNGQAVNLQAMSTSSLQASAEL